jgi:hypothetical protein
MHQASPMSILIAAMGNSAVGRELSDAILESEAAAALCAASKGKDCELPKDVDPKSREVLEAGGVKFLGDVPGDAIFQRAQLPPGWEIKRTDHSMWTQLCDDKGRERASIFYKAAVYDRSARMTISCRFKIDTYYNTDSETVAVARVNDQGAFPFESERLDIKTDADKHGVYDRTTHEYTTPSKRDQARAQCSTWLKAHYPDCDNPAAYWD